MGARDYETEIDFSVWRFTGKCGTCSGITKYKYAHLTKPNVELQVVPSNKPNSNRFQVVERINNRKAVTIQGKISDMKTLLASI